jgi:ABC-type glutathione transport system ATPase component
MLVSAQSLAISVENLTVGFGERRCSIGYRWTFDVDPRLVGMSGGGKSVLLQVSVA